MLIHNKDDIEFVTEFPCFLGHSVAYTWTQNFGEFEKIYKMSSWQIYIFQWT